MDEFRDKCGPAESGAVQGNEHEAEPIGEDTLLNEDKGVRCITCALYIREVALKDGSVHVSLQRIVIHEENGRS